jgi:SAM-dependent methyltransferase
MSASKRTVENETLAATTTTAATPGDGDGGGAAAVARPAAAETAAFDFRPTPCGACGGDDPQFFGWRGGTAHHNGAGVRTRLVRCGVCTHIYPNPMPFPARGLADLYVDTDEMFQGHDVEGKKLNGLENLRSIEQQLGGRGRYLDVGCGLGENLWAAREAGWEYEGVDVSPAYLKWAEDHLGVRARLGTLEEMNYPDNHFDAITMNAILEHLYDPYATLKEVYRVLKPGGLFWFDAPNEDGLYMRMGNFYMKAQGRDWVITLAPTFSPYHVQGFNPRSLRHLTERVGFEIASFRMHGNIWPPTGEPTLRKRIEYRGAQLINWVGRRMGAGIYLYVAARKPSN